MPRPAVARIDGPAVSPEPGFAPSWDRYEESLAELLSAEIGAGIERNEDGGDFAVIQRPVCLSADGFKVVEIGVFHRSLGNDATKCIPLP
jgi:hypothetical protein